MIKINKLTKYYGKTLGVKNLSLEVKEGEVFGFIGPNGAGKSTTIRCIMNLINRTEGEIFINSKEKEYRYSSISFIQKYLLHAASNFIL